MASIYKILKVYWIINLKKKYQPEVKETVTMTEESAREISNRLKSGESNISLAKEYKVTDTNISRIKKQFEKLENK